jgi:hypothetical protein
MSGSCVLQNPGDVVEQGPPFVIKSQTCAGCRKGLTGESRDEQFESWQRGRFDRLDVAEGSVGEVSVISLDGPLVNLGVTYALEVDAQFFAGGTYPQLKASDPGAQR